MSLRTGLYGQLRQPAPGAVWRLGLLLSRDHEKKENVTWIELMTSHHKLAASTSHMVVLGGGLFLTSEVPL